MTTKTEKNLVPKQVKVAKDLLNLLTGAMYVNPLSALREYVQNSVDAIDEAVAHGHYRVPGDGRIDIKLDPTNRSMILRDDGVGCSNGNFSETLTAFGGSDKKGRNLRGFRGIGRLAGLAYCRSLIFRSKSIDDKSVLEMEWDCVKLKEMLYTDDNEYSLNQIVRSVITVRKLAVRDFPEYFFEVELRGLVRYKNDYLINRYALSEYLSQVAPVPFSPEFRYGGQISEFLREKIGDQTFSIFLDSSESPVYKPFRNSFLARKDVHSRFSELEFLELPGIQQEVDSVGWLLHHDYLGAISPNQNIEGLRLRIGNIQVGDNGVLCNIFPQSRFNGWCCGEIHVLNTRIRPNGRRDDLEYNAHVTNLHDKLRPVGLMIARKCREFSATRSALNRFDKECGDSQFLMDLLADGYFNRRQTAKYVSKLETQENLLSEMVAQLDKRFSDEPMFKQRLANWRRKRSNTLRKVRENGSGPELPKSKASVYHHVFEAIFDEIQDKGEAASVIRRVADVAVGKHLFLPNIRPG